MRDLRHLEELSSATAFGSWANDVVVALDKLREGEDLEDTDVRTLDQAASLLEAVSDPGTTRQAPDMARSLAAGETTKTAVAAVLGRRPGEENRARLLELATVARRSATGAAAGPDRERLDEIIELF